MKFVSKTIFLSIVALLTSSFSAFAQCAMCRATVESSMVDGDVTIAAGLNTGIFYLLATPYVVIAVVAYFWYKKSRENAKKIKTIRYR